MNNTKDFLTLEEAQSLAQYTKPFLCAIVAAGIVNGTIPKNDYNEDFTQYTFEKESLVKFIEARKNGYRLPSPPELEYMIQQNKAKLRS